MNSVIKNFIKDFPPDKLIRDSRVYLFAAAFLLAVARIVVASRILFDEDAFMDTLTVGAILFLLWKRRNSLKLESSVVASGLGFILLFLMTFKGLSIFWFEPYFIRIATFGAAIGLALIASGFKGLKQYGAEFFIVLLLCVPSSMIFTRVLQAIDITALTAKFSHLILWYLGFQSIRQGAFIYLPNGGVEILVYCTGLSSSLALLRLAFLCMAVFLKSWTSRFIIGIGAILIGFFLGAFRVILMALIVADRPNFEFWHGHTGSQVFSTIGILVFGLLANYLITKADAPVQES
jgi:cyanoexosortase A